MTRINLLSSRLIEARARRERRALRLACACAAAALMIMWAGAAWWQLTGVNRQIATARQAMAPLLVKCQELRQVEEDQRELQSRQAKISSLRECVPTTAVLALLTQLTPAAIELRSLTVDVPDPTTPAPKVGPAARSPALHISLEGAAADDVTIASYVATLAHHPNTVNVRLEDVRQAVAGEVTQTAFRISFDMPLLRDDIRGPGGAP